MALKKFYHTEGDKRVYFVDYSNDMRRGDWITAVAVVVDQASVTLSAATIIEPSEISFFADGGVVGEDFIVTVTVTINDTEVYNDTLEFHVVAP